MNMRARRWPWPSVRPRVHDDNRNPPRLPAAGRAGLSKPRGALARDQRPLRGLQTGAVLSGQA